MKQQSWVERYTDDSKVIVSNVYKISDQTLIEEVVNEVLVADSIKKIDVNKGDIFNYLPSYHPLFDKCEIRSSDVSWLIVDLGNGDVRCFDRVEFKSVINGVYFYSLPLLTQIWWMINWKSFSDGDRVECLKLESAF